MSVYVLDLSNFDGFEHGTKEDITDFFMRHSGSADNLVDAFKQLRAATPSPVPHFRFWTAAELAEPVPNMAWLVRGVWPSGSYGTLAGEKKTLKTYMLFDLALSVASGEPFLGRFAVPEPRPVVMLAGEGGSGPGRRRLQRIADSKGVDLARLPLTVSFNAGDMISDDFQTAVAEQIDALNPGLIIVDPLYAYHPPNIEAQNLYDRGRMLSGLTATIPEGCAFIVADHFRKTGSKDLDLDSIAQAGVGQWADSWILQAHASPPQVDTGEFQLAVQFAGREWGGAQYIVAWQIGAFREEDGTHDGPLSVEVLEAEWDTRAARPTDDSERTEAMALHLAAEHQLTRNQLMTELKHRAKVGTHKARGVSDDLLSRGRLTLVTESRREGDRDVTREIVRPAASTDENTVRVPLRSQK